jgi:hypothetical protein
MLLLILETPSSNRVVKFTNILNLSAIKFHITSIQFLKGSESSAVLRRNGDGFIGSTDQPGAESQDSLFS